MTTIERKGTDTLDGVKQKVSVIRGQYWMKPMIVVMLAFLFFTSSVQATSSLVLHYANAKDNTVEAGWWNSAADAVEGWFRGAFGSEQVATIMTDTKYDGTEWIITPPAISSSANYQTKGMGISSDKAPFNKDSLSKDGETGQDAADMFMAFQYWGSQYGVYSGYDWTTNFITKGLNSFGRYAGGLALMATSIIGRVVQLMGNLVYQAIDTFNVFKYILPDSTADGNLLSKWEYNDTNNPIMAYFADWLNFGRLFGYLLAVILFVAGLGLSVLGIRIGKSQSMGGSIWATVQRMLVSVFALTGAIFILSGTITVFSEKMQESDDQFEVDYNIAGLILDYKGYVSSGYAYDDGSVDLDNKDWSINSDGVESLQAVEKMYSSGSLGDVDMAIAKTVSSDDIRQMNKYAKAYTGTVDESTVKGTDYIVQFLNFESTRLIKGWMVGDVTTSTNMSTAFGKGSMPYAIYRVKADNDGILRVEDSGFFSTVFNYRDFTIPGGFGGFFRALSVIGGTLIISVFATAMYRVMIRSIINMVGQVIIWFPSGAGLGSVGGLFMLFGAVITMFVQMVIARLMISLFKDVLTSTKYIFPALTEFLPSGKNGIATIMNPMVSMTPTNGPFTFGTIFPFAKGTESVGEILLATILLWVIGILLYNQFRKLNDTLGSSVGQFFTDMAGRISGVRPGSNPFGRGSMNSDGSLETTTTTESEESSSVGSFSENEASQMGLAGNIIGGIGGESAFGSGTSSGSTDGYLAEDQEANQDRLNDSLTPESALAGTGSGLSSVEEEALGGVGAASAEETTDVSDMSTSGSSSSATDDTSPVSDDGLSSVSDGDSLGDVGNGADTESESARKHRERVEAEQEIDASGMNGLDDSFSGTNDDMDSSDTIDGMEHIHVNTGQEFDDAGASADAAAQHQTADHAADESADTTQELTEGDLAYIYGEGDVSADSAAGQSGAYDMDNSGQYADTNQSGQDYDQDIAMDGDDRTMHYDQDDDDTIVDSSMANGSGYDVQADELDRNGDVRNADINADQSTDDQDITRQLSGDDGVVSVDTQADEMDMSTYDNSDVDALDANTAFDPYDTAGYDTSANGLNDDQTESLQRDVNGEQAITQTVNDAGEIESMQHIEQGNENMTHTDAAFGNLSAMNDAAPDAAGNVEMDQEGYAIQSDSATEQDRRNDMEHESATYLNTDTDYDTDYRTEDGNASMRQSFNQMDVSGQGAVPMGYQTDESIGQVEANAFDTGSQQQAVNTVIGTSEDNVQMDQSGQMDHQQRIREGSEQFGESFNNVNTYIDDAPAMSNPGTVGDYNRTLPGATSSETVTSTVSGQNDEDVTIDQAGSVEYNQTVSEGDYHVDSTPTGTQRPSFGRVSSDVDNGSGNGYTMESADHSNPYTATVTPRSESGYSNGSQSDDPIRAVKQTQSSREGQFETNNKKTKTTSTTRYTPPSSGYGTSEGSDMSRYGTPVDGGYIDFNGQFHSTSSSALAGDLTGYFGGSSGSSGAIPKQTLRNMNREGQRTGLSRSDQGESTERSYKAKRSQPTEYATSTVDEESWVSQSESTDTVSGIFGDDGLFSGTKSSQSSNSLFSRDTSSTKSSTDGPKFGRRND